MTEQDLPQFLRPIAEVVFEIRFRAGHSMILIFTRTVAIRRLSIYVILRFSSLYHF